MSTEHAAPLDGDSINPLFRERTPNAAAGQLAIVLAWLAECELATLERMRGLKKPIKSELKRHESICATMVYHLQELGVQPRGLYGRHCGRVEEWLKIPKSALVERMRD